MYNNEYQRIQDEKYAIELGYNVELDDNDQLEFEMTHLFDYEQKTKEYLDQL